MAGVVIVQGRILEDGIQRLPCRVVVPGPSDQVLETVAALVVSRVLDSFNGVFGLALYNNGRRGFVYLAR